MKYGYISFVLKTVENQASPVLQNPAFFANSLTFIENLKFTSPLLLILENSSSLSNTAGGGFSIRVSIHEHYYNVDRLDTRVHENSRAHNVDENILLYTGMSVQINCPFFRPWNTSPEQRRFGSLNYHLIIELP